MPADAEIARFSELLGGAELSVLKTDGTADAGA
jgi:hypothetical protein